MSAPFKLEDEPSPYSGTGSDDESHHEGEDEALSSATAPSAPDAATPNQVPAVPQKRKGGRKPIYATSEERKQRNRQAQAAFRERRTEYIKHLETTIKSHEDNSNSLNAKIFQLADENASLRYRQTMLERIMMEKGLDVNSEVSQRSGSPSVGLPPPASMMGHPNHSPSSQAIMHNSFQPGHRGLGSVSGLAAKQPGGAMYGGGQPMYPNQHIPTSTFSSPAHHHSPAGYGQGGRLASMSGESYGSPAPSQSYGHPGQRAYSGSAGSSLPSNYHPGSGLPAPHGQQPFLGSNSYHDQPEHMEGFQSEQHAGQPQLHALENTSAPFQLPSRQMPGIPGQMPPIAPPDAKHRFRGYGS